MVMKNFLFCIWDQEEEAGEMTTFLAIILLEEGEGSAQCCGGATK